MIVKTAGGMFYGIGLIGDRKNKEGCVITMHICHFAKKIASVLFKKWEIVHY